MADPAAVGALLAGPDEWLRFNQSFDFNRRPRIDLSKVDLSQREFLGYKLFRVDLSDCKASPSLFENTRFRDVSLAGANLGGSSWNTCLFLDVDLDEATFDMAAIDDSSVDSSSLARAKFSRAELLRTAFRHSDLSGASFRDATLSMVMLASSQLRNAQFSGAQLFETQIDNVDLSEALGLDAALHRTPSSIGVDTLYRSGGKIPESFLRGCGVPEELIAYLPSLTGSAAAINYRSCFISYSSKDEAFSRRLHSRLRSETVRVWFAPEDLKGGDKIRDQIDRAIELYDRLIIVLSEHSMESEWVKREVRRARRQEIREKRRKLFPIRLVDYETLQAWVVDDSVSGSDLAEEVRQYFIPDFSTWKNEDDFEAAFARLLRDLKSADDPPASFVRPDALQ